MVVKTNGTIFLVILVILCFIFPHLKLFLYPSNGLGCFVFHIYNCFSILCIQVYDHLRFPFFFSFGLFQVTWVSSAASQHWLVLFCQKLLKVSSFVILFPIILLCTEKWNTNMSCYQLVKTLFNIGKNHL